MYASTLCRVALRSVTLAMTLLVVCLRIGHAEWAQSLSAENPRTPKVFAVLASGSNLLAAFESGVFRSSDQGATWTHCDLGVTDNPTVYSLASNGSMAFAGTVANGIYKSTDNGLTWTQSGLAGEYIKPSWTPFSISMI